MAPYTILVCDDKEAVHESLSFFLRKEGMDVLDAYDGTGAIIMQATHRIDLAVLDIMLPDMDGMELCRRLRKDSDILIIFLSARTEEEDRIAGLESGGDDYVTKPYSPREVALRVRKLLERRKPAVQTSGQIHSAGNAENAGNLENPGSPGNAVGNTIGRPGSSAHRILCYNELSLDQDAMEVFLNGEKIDMTGREVQFLKYLLENPNRVLNREQILTAVWGFDYYGDTRTVDATVKRIRKKLPSENVHFSIQSIYGVGYRLGTPAS